MYERSTIFYATSIPYIDLINAVNSGRSQKSRAGGSKPLFYCDRHGEMGETAHRRRGAYMIGGVLWQKEKPLSVAVEELYEQRVKDSF